MDDIATRRATDAAISAARGARIVLIEAKSCAAGLLVAEGVVSESAPRATTSIRVAVPRMEDGILEEVAAAIVLELAVPSAPREDGAGLHDAAAEALRHAAPAFVVLTEVDAWLAHGGEAQLASWAEETPTTFLLVGTEGHRARLTPDTPRVVVELSDEHGIFEMLERRWDVLTKTEHAIVTCLARCPVAVPAALVVSAVGIPAVCEALDTLARDGVVTIAWTAGELFVGLSGDAAAIHRGRPEVDGAADEADQRLIRAAIGAAGDILDTGEVPTFRDLELLARQRAALRALLSRARHDRDDAARLTLVTMTALEPLGPLLEVTALAERACGVAILPALRSRLEERRARVLRTLGRLADAARCLDRAASDASALSARARARLAFSMGRMALPELEGAHLAARALELVAALPDDDAFVAALVAHTRSAVAWNTVSAEAAIPPNLDAIVRYGRARGEQLKITALANLSVHHLGAERPHDAAALARQLEREAVRLGRTELVAVACEYRGCAALQAGDPHQAIRLLSYAVETLSALGYRHSERWARAHRGLAMLAADRMADAARDFEDFVAMTRVVGGSDLVGVIGGALSGCTVATARLRALADDDVTPYLRAVARAARVISTDEPASRRIISEVAAPPPGYFAFEVRELERAAIRATAVAPAQAVSTSPSEMLVSRDAAWFELDGEPRVSLGKTRTLRQVMHGLVVAHARRRKLELEEIFTLGWPGEQATAASRANRVHVTLSRLRAAGLRDALAFDDGGWGLHAELRVVTV